MFQLILRIIRRRIRRNSIICQIVDVWLSCIFYQLLLTGIKIICKNLFLFNRKPSISDIRLFNHEIIHFSIFLKINGVFSIRITFFSLRIRDILILLEYFLYFNRKENHILNSVIFKIKGDIFCDTNFTENNLRLKCCICKNN